MNQTDQDRLNRLRKLAAGPKWDDAAGETTTDFLLRLLDEAWTVGYNKAVVVGLEAARNSTDAIAR